MLNCYCQVQLFLYNMVLANQNAKLTGPDQGFLVSPLVLTLKPWERGWLGHFRGEGGVDSLLMSLKTKITKHELPNTHNFCRAKIHSNHDEKHKEPS
jgi:hypothetical protein